MASPIGLNGTHNTRERYADLIVKLLRKQLVTNEYDIFNTDYEGDPTSGAVQIPVRDGEVVVSDYDVASGIAPTQSATTYLTVTLDNNKAVNELIDGFEAAAVPDNLVAQRLDSAGYSLGLTVDTDAITTLETEGTTSTNTTESTSATIYNNILVENEELDNSDVPREDRYLIIAPKYLRLLKQDDNFVSSFSDTGFQEVKKAGFVGYVDGLPVYMSNNMTADTEFIIGGMYWSQRIMEWQVTPYLTSLDQSANYVGASAIKGRMIYKHKVTKAAAVRVKTFV